MEDITEVLMVVVRGVTRLVLVAVVELTEVVAVVV
jgi:hypothetical protein